jgi:hypothetical protein
MNLDFLDVLSQTTSKAGGTRGTGGTSNIYAVSSVPPAIPAWGNMGNKTANAESDNHLPIVECSPVFPVCSPEQETETANGYAAVPLVPLVPPKNEDVLERNDPPPDAKDPWREDFIRWARERCAFRNGCDNSAGIGFLLVDFAEWCAARDAVPCRRATFELLLQDAGIPLRDGMAAGLVLKVAVQSFQNPAPALDPVDGRHEHAHEHGGSPRA